MASTRNINTPGDYAAEQSIFKRQIHYLLNKEYGEVTPTYAAGKGLIQGHLPDHKLSGNPNDIESSLFGIGSTNLVNPQPPVVPELKKLKELSIVDRSVPSIMPRSFNPLDDQRPFPIAK